jgi:hypothetical protein
VRVEAGWAAGLSFKRSGDFRRAAIPIYIAGFERAFKRDNGIPHLAELTGNVMVIATWPTMIDDPEKPIRAAAFAGWAMTPV